MSVFQTLWPVSLLWTSLEGKMKVCLGTGMKNWQKTASDDCKMKECITMSTESNTIFEYKPKVSFYKIAHEPRRFRGFENTIVWRECLDVYCMQPAASMSGTLISFFSVKAEEQPTATFPDEHNY